MELASFRSTPALLVLVLAGCSYDPVAPPPEFPVAVPRFVTLSAGNGYTCGLADNGALWCWGFNTAGQLASGSSEPAMGDGAYFPTHVAEGFQFRSISTGEEHMCGVALSGKGYCWGLDSGLLGAGPRADTRSNLPVAVAGSHTFRSIQAGYQHTCAVTTDDKGYCWGSNESHQLGIGEDGDRDVPTAIAGDVRLAAISNRLGSTGAVDQNSCGLDLDNAAWCWGGNQGGALGTGAADLVGSAVPVAAAAGIHFTSISVAGGYACGISTDEELLCWGRGNATPVSPSGSVAWKSVSVGGPHSCAISAARDLYCWGSNTRGQLGIGAAGIISVDQPTLVAGDREWLEVTVGGYHTCAIAADHSAWCWGSGGQGELGVGGLVSPAYQSAVPVRVAETRP